MSKTNKNSVIIKHQYIKDLSFENPLSPDMISLNAVPKVNIEVKLNFLTIKDNDHEIILYIKSDTQLEDKLIYMLEIQYGGIFNFVINDETRKKELIINAAEILFPFARSLIANITREGGYNPLIIQPFDFKNIYKN